MHCFYIFNLKKKITIICWCTLYEDKIVLHNSFINVLFNEIIEKRVAMR